jgi:hypothetical protein
VTTPSTTRTDLGDRIHFRQLLTCGHRAVAEYLTAEKYPSAFCDRCQDVRDFAKARPRSR